MLEVSVGYEAFYEVKQSANTPVLCQVFFVVRQAYCSECNHLLVVVSPTPHFSLSTYCVWKGLSLLEN